MFGAQGLVSRNTQTNGLSSASMLWYAFDERGSVAQRTGSSGGVVSSDLYDAFGNVTSTGGPDVFGFGGQAGYYTDVETGLILCTHRFYDPQQGRFLTRDPLGYAGGINLYSYTANNPVNGMDPDGLDWLDNAANFSAGWGDTLTFGATKWGRLGAGELVGAGDANEGIDYNSGWYHGGQVAGYVNGIALGPAGTLNGGARSVFYSGQGALAAARAGKGTGLLLEDTFGGKVLNAADGALRNRFGRGFPGGFWKGPSAIYALNAKGTATAFLRNPGTKSVWNTVEKPILKACKVNISPR